MAKLAIRPGSTSVSLLVWIQDSASTTGAGKTGITFDAAGLTAYYHRPLAEPVAIPLASLAANTTAYTSGGFRETDATNLPGEYRLDIPDAVLAAGARSVLVLLKGAAGMAPCPLEIDLTAGDLPTAQTIEDEIFGRVVEGTETFEQAVRIARAALAGTSAGGGTTTHRYKSASGAKDRIVATVDATGNRTAVTTDGT